MEVITKEKLEVMQEVDIKTVDPESLADINDVKINTYLPVAERVKDFIRQVKNIHCIWHNLSQLYQF